jgi:hypothetical protein
MRALHFLLMLRPSRTARALIRIVLSLAAPAAAMSAGAQASLGPAEDATVAPPGVLRARIGNSWTSYYENIYQGGDAANGYIQVRYTTFSVEFGVLPGLSLTYVAPEAGNTSATRWTSSYGFVTDSFVKNSHNGIGDMEVGAKFAWLRGPGEYDRLALTGVHLRSSLSGSWRFPTGTGDDPEVPFDVGTGSQRPAATVASQTDLMIGKVFWISAVGRYIMPQPATVPVLVHPPGLPLSNIYGVMDAQVSGGNSYVLEATPRAVLGPYFMIGGQYQYVNRAQNSYVGTKTDTIAGVPVVVDASTLNAGTAATLQTASAMITFSTVAMYLEKASGFPIEVSYQHTWTVAATGATPPASITDVVTIRLWARLWGGWKPKPQPK